MVPANNASGNYFYGKPYGYEVMDDSVFIVTLLKQPGTLIVNSGSNSQTLQAPAGAAAFEVSMGLGQQSFILERNGAVVQGLEGASLKDITNVCNCGSKSPCFVILISRMFPPHSPQLPTSLTTSPVYNFNAYVGTLPTATPDPMGPDGLNSLTIGLHVSTCSERPSLATSAPAITATNVPGKTTTGSPTATPTTTAKPTTTTTGATTPATTTAKPTGTCTSMITASSQIFPTNCLLKGECWAGPAGQSTPDRCDGQ